MNLFSVLVDGKVVGFRLKVSGTGLLHSLSVNDMIKGAVYEDEFNQWLKDGEHIALLDKLDGEDDIADLCYIRRGTMYMNPAMIGYFMMVSKTYEDGNKVGTTLLHHGHDRFAVPLPSFMYHLYTYFVSWLKNANL